MVSHNVDVEGGNQGGKQGPGERLGGPQENQEGACSIHGRMGGGYFTHM